MLFIVEKYGHSSFDGKKFNLDMVISSCIEVVCLVKSVIAFKERCMLKPDILD